MPDLIWQCRECTALWNSERARDECEAEDRDADRVARRR